MVKPKPRLNPYLRHLVCQRVREEHWSVSAAARAAGVSRQTAHTWLRRFTREGPAGLADRSSRPHRMPRLTRIDLAVQICVERTTRKVGPHELALLLGMARSTIYAVLRRAELSRPGALTVKRAVLRYEWPAPGDMVHLDIKRLGRIPEDAGWRNIGRRLANALKRHAGYEYCHVAVDDHSRLPIVAMHSDQKSTSAIRSLEAVWGRYLRAGVRIRRILTDNGSCYRSLDFAAACLRLGIEHWRTRPYTPRTNGKAERFIKTLQEKWAYVRLYRSSAERTSTLARFLDEYSQRRSPTLDGHTPLCRFFGVNDLSGNHI
ncbi:MAG: IS481 family transposase [Planctomycetota bacterium]|nr:IS481 family transposase [Planctomycetota bacterium]